MTFPYITDQTLELDTTTLHYLIRGDGQPIVLLHAGIADSRVWQHQIEALEVDYQVIAYDLRGFGQSPLTGEATYSHEEDLDALLNHLGCDDVILMAMSMGGKVAINYALQNLAKIKRLILIGSALDGFSLRDNDPDLPALWKQLGEIYETSGADATAQFETSMWLAGAHREMDTINSQLVDQVKTMILQTYHWEELGENTTEKSYSPSAAKQLDKINMPTLIIVGNEDAISIQKIADLLDDQIVDSQKLVMENTAHLPNFEHPQAFNELIREWLSSVSAI